MPIPLTDDGDTALHMAVGMEQTNFVEKLIKLMSVEDMEILKVDGNTAFFLAAFSGNVKFAKLLLHKNPGLVWIKEHKNMLPIELASSANQPLMLMEEEESPNYERISNAMFDAVKLGNDMVLEFIFRFNPTLFTKVNSDGQSLLHIAILYPQASIFQLIMRKGVYKNAMVQVVDNEGNNILHLAGRLVAEERFQSMVLLMCSEEPWFKGVKDIIPPGFKSMENRDRRTAEELFYKEHRELSEKVIKDMNETTNTFVLAGTLIVTFGITAALTIRTNNIQGRRTHGILYSFYQLELE
ncbi:hypothetical protein PIB30_064495 [Stylosanthes scabra]|uniref:PGG domain-containing protein n=1 Tax=Stylosanthes scabra TaxID=79078 RepID=A0ABU6UKL2_9FABA|nr:hypothetical protein [Stylosanthes scabra]